MHALSTEQHAEASAARRLTRRGFAGATLTRRGFAGAMLSTLAVLAACAPRVQAPVVAPPPPVVEAPPPPVVEQVHRIAILVPLTGPNAPVGISLANAASLALVDTGTRGIRLSSYDTAALGAGGAARRAVTDGAELILGPLLSGNAAAVKAVAEPKGITMLSFSNDAAIAGGRLYVLGYQPAQSVSRVVDYAAARGARKFAALVPEGVYGQRTSVAFTRAVSGKDAQVVSLTSFARSSAALPAAARKVTNYDERLKANAPLDFDALLIADSGAVAAAFSPQLARFGAAPGSYLLMGTELWNTEPGLGRSAALKDAIFASVPDQRFQSMSRRYQARFGGTPSRLASLAYDSVLLVASAPEGEWRIGQPFPQQLLEDANGFAGVDGIFRFRGNIAERGLEVQQVTPEGFVTIDPAPASF